MSYLQRASRPPNDRTMAVACVAEVAKEIGNAITPYVEVCNLNIFISCRLSLLQRMIVNIDSFEVARFYKQFGALFLIYPL